MSTARITYALPTPEQAHSLSVAGFGAHRNYLYQTNQRLLQTCDFGVTAFPADTSEPLGFGLFRIRPVEQHLVLFLTALIVGPARQGEGLGKRMLKHGLELAQPDYLAFNTASPRMYATAQGFVETLYPTLDGQTAPDDITHVSRSLTGAEPYVGNLVRKKWFNGYPLYAEQPTHENDTAFYRLFDYEYGDALLCIGRVAADGLDL